MCEIADKSGRLWNCAAQQETKGEGAIEDVE